MKVEQRKELIKDKEKGGDRKSQQRGRGAGVKRD